MKIDYHKTFKKEFRKLSAKQQAKFAQRIALFVEQPAHSQLRIHQLSGDFKDSFSFSIAGDLRVHFQYISENHILLTRIGTHAQLYE